MYVHVLLLKVVGKQINLCDLNAYNIKAVANIYLFICFVHGRSRPLYNPQGPVCWGFVIIFSLFHLVNNNTNKRIIVVSKRDIVNDGYPTKNAGC